MNLYKYNKKTLQVEKITNKEYLTFSLIIMASCLFSLFILNTMDKIVNHDNETKASVISIDDLEDNNRPILICQDDEFSEEKLVELLLGLNVKFPDIAFAQARYESGNWGTNPGANIFETNNNLFGMKIATQRPTTNEGIFSKHAVYESWRMSVIDYALWQANMTTGLNTRESYMAFLKKRYAEGTYVSIGQITKQTQKKYPQLFVKRFPALEKIKVTLSE